MRIVVNGPINEEWLRNDREPQGAEVSIKREGRHVIEERGYNYKGNRVAERKSMVAAVPAENLFHLCAHGLAIVHDVEVRLDFSKKRQSFTVSSPITKQVNVSLVISQVT